MKVIIAGSRSIANPLAITVAVGLAKFELTEIVSGGARGVDDLGEFFAKRRGIPVKRFIPAWHAHGKRAGFLRNIDMAHYADALIAIWDGKSPGTKHMIETMQALQKPVYIQNWTLG